MYAGRPWVLLERGWIAFRSTNWIPVVTGFVEPVLFLLAFGYGMGNLVGDVTTGNTMERFMIQPGMFFGNSMNPSCTRPCSQLHLDLLISHWVRSPGL